MKRRSGFIPVLLLPAGSVGAEGVVKTLECTIERLCYAAGSCSATSGSASFRLEPVELDANGAPSRYDDPLS
jgi:hypothetical protein